MLSNIERTVDSAHRRALFPDEFAQQFETVSAGSGQAESIVQVAFQQSFSLTGRQFPSASIQIQAFVSHTGHFPVHHYGRVGAAEPCQELARVILVKIVLGGFDARAGPVNGMVELARLLFDRVNIVIPIQVGTGIDGSRVAAMG